MQAGSYEGKEALCAGRELGDLRVDSNGCLSTGAHQAHTMTYKGLEFHMPKTCGLGSWAQTVGNWD